MLKRKLAETTAAASESTSTPVDKKQKQAEARDVSRYVNKQRCLILSSRGITHRDRHLLSDLRDLLPHSKKDVKLDSKDELNAINELCEMKNCNSVLFLEARKRKDLYLWMAKAPNGPSVKFLVQNIHTMAEVKLTGNCLKGSRPFLSFDARFDTEPHLRLLKEMFTQTFGSPKGHPKVKPFIDHVLSFFIADNRIWFRNYQVVHQIDEQSKKEKPVLVEIGPRCVLNPIRIFAGSMSGATIWENADYVSPNLMRSMLRDKKKNKYTERTQQTERTREHQEFARLDGNPVDNVFEHGEILDQEEEELKRKMKRAMQQQGNKQNDDDDEDDVAEEDDGQDEEDDDEEEDDEE